MLRKGVEVTQDDGYRISDDLPELCLPSRTLPLEFSPSRRIGPPLGRDCHIFSVGCQYSDQLKLRRGRSHYEALHHSESARRHSAAFCNIIHMRADFVSKHRDTPIPPPSQASSTPKISPFSAMATFLACSEAFTGSKAKHNSQHKSKTSRASSKGSDIRTLRFENMVKLLQSSAFGLRQEEIEHGSLHRTPDAKENVSSPADIAEGNRPRELVEKTTGVDGQIAKGHPLQKSACSRIDPWEGFFTRGSRTLARPSNDSTSTV